MIGETRAYLEANKNAAGFKLVAGALEFSVAGASAPTATPAVYVLAGTEDPGENELENGIGQMIEVEISVVIALSAAKDALGGGAIDPLEQRRKALRDLLLGWRPADGVAPFELGISHSLGFKNNHAYWQDFYRTRYYLEAK